MSADLRIPVVQADGVWVISGERVQVRLDSASLGLQIQTGSQRWSMLPPGADDLVVHGPAGEACLSLAAAGRIRIAPRMTGFGAGLELELDGFTHQGTPLDLRLRLLVDLEWPEEELVFQVLPCEGQAAIRQCRWPGPFAPNQVDATIVPFMQGMLLPRDWPREVRLYDSMCYGRGLYMPWWGHTRGNDSVLVLLETPDDGGCRFSHPAGGPTRIEVQWTHSLGRLAYPRRVRVCFFTPGGYVNLAKRYRRHLVENGRFASLAEKIARSPLVERLMGSPVVHTSILYHVQPDSSYYSPSEPAKNHQLVTFDQRAEQLRRLAALGIERAYVHLDGWGFRGYDNLHPDVLPPCPEAGGWDGMRRLATACADLGFVLALHDQYRDYYHDAASYDPRHTLLDGSGERPFGTTWYGGAQSILCARLAPGHVARNWRAILQEQVPVRGAYLDVFAVVPPDECYHPEHPMTRSECLVHRAACFSLIRSLAGVVSSEEPADWAVPHLDLVHHGPYALDPNPGSGPAMGIPVPLLNLVYHDSILLPWSLGRGAWGIPETDLGFLHGMANAGLPYLSEQPGPEELRKVRAMCRLHQRVGALEMVGHEFVDGSRRRQRTRYADGTQVTIGLDADTWEVSPALEG